MAIQLNEERLTESVGIVKGCMNSNVLDVMQNLSAAIMPEAGTNQLVDQAIEDCRKFQNQFNETTKGLRDFITEMGKVLDIKEYLDKLSIGTVSNRDTSIVTGKIDADAVIQ